MNSSQMSYESYQQIELRLRNDHPLWEQKEFLTNVESILQEYIPYQLLKEAMEKRKGVSLDGKDIVKFYINNSNNKLRMYGTAEQLEANLKVFWNFPMRRKMFPTDNITIMNTVPTEYRSLKGEHFICKQDFLRMFFSKVHESFLKVETSSGFREHIENYERRLNRCFEFVKYDEQLVERCSKLITYLANYLHGQFLVKPSERRFASIEQLDAECPGFFLPNKEVKNANVSVLVRIFEVGDEQFVMESELFNAINLKNPSQKPLECNDPKGFLRAMSIGEVEKKFRDQIIDVDFIRSPVLNALYASVPIPTPTGEFCILAISGLEIIYYILFFVWHIFERIDRSKWHILIEYFRFLDSQFPSKIDCTLFINLSTLKGIIKKTDEYWKRFENIPVKTVRDVGPNGFTIEDLKKELEYLGLYHVLPATTDFWNQLYDNGTFGKLPNELKTYHMFHMIRTFQATSVLEHFPQQKTIFEALKIRNSSNNISNELPRAVTKEEPKNSEKIEKLAAPCAPELPKKLEDEECMEVSRENLVMLKKALKEKNLEVEELKKKQKALEEKAEMATEWKRSYEAKSDQLKKTLDMMGSFKEETERSDEIRKRLEEAMGRSAGLEKKLEEVQKEMAEKDVEIQRMREENTGIEEKAKKIDGLEKKYNETLKKLEEDKNSEIQKNECLEKRLEELEESNQSHLKELEGKNLEIQKFLKDKEINEKTMEDLRKKMKEYAKEMEEIAKQLGELKETKSAIIQKKNDEMENLKQSNLKLIEGKEAEIEKMKKSQEQQKRAIERLKQVRKSNQQQISEQSTANKQLQNKILLISLENQQKSKVLQDIQTSISSLTSSNHPPTDLECLICLAEMKSEEKTLKCEHCRKITHLECASKWLKIHRSCPHCRREQLDPNEFPNLQ